LSQPSPLAINKAVKQLKGLGAIDTEGALTKIGQEMIELPVSPPQSRILIQSKGSVVLRPILTIIAMMNVDNLYLREDAKASFKSASGDHLTLLNIYK
jgi:HrpA-like RNA helicase